MLFISQPIFVSMNLIWGRHYLWMGRKSVLFFFQIKHVDKRNGNTVTFPILVLLLGIELWHYLSYDVIFNENKEPLSSGNVFSHQTIIKNELVLSSNPIFYYTDKKYFFKVSCIQDRKKEVDFCANAGI